ncbi:CU044_5270 family protein [Streptomyces sp. NPDC059697]|uniref:CU044_5270 family protein n=1 Tax=Streptomyces sp. NPDC059697 TaxID=3346912 RepID=UPI0036A01C16
MDDLTELREWEAGNLQLTPQARAAARARLLGAIDHETRQSTRSRLSRRLALRGAFVGAAAAAVAGIAVAVTRDGDNEGTPNLTMLSAAQILQKAADASRADRSRLPIPRDDQYFYTRTYIARTPRKGGRTRTWTDESWMSVDGSKPSRRQEYGKVHHDPPLSKHEVRWPPTVYAKLKKLPTDPDKLLETLRHGQKSTPQTDRDAFFDACLLMQGPRVMPPGLQAAAFGALAGIPRVRVDRDEVDILGRRGIGVSYPGIDFTFLFDRDTYVYLGMRLKGSTVKLVHGDWQETNPYFETKGLQQIAVVDRIGQRP